LQKEFVCQIYSNPLSSPPKREKEKKKKANLNPTSQRVGQFENMVILFMHHYDLNLEQALECMLDLIRKHYEICSEAEKRLPVTGDPQLDANIKTYVVGCRDLAIGTAFWR
jgi:hypothetical protein